MTNLGAHSVGTTANASFNGGFDIAAAGNVLTVTQVVGGTGSLTKIGSGMLVLAGTNTYTGGTTVLDGTLDITSADALPPGTTLSLAATASGS